MSLLNVLSASVGLMALGANAYRVPFSFSYEIGPAVPAAPAAPAAPSSPKYVASTYFAGWHANEGFPLDVMPWDKYTDVKFAFAETTPNGGLDLSASEPDQLPLFVKAAKQNGVKALIAIGGWTGSKYYSTSVGSDKNRTAFVETVIDFVQKYKLDGVDFNWEYPNRQGLGCNVINPRDTTNFLKFLQEFRKHPVGKDLYVTSAGSLFPWNNENGAASTEGLDGFAKVLDYLMIMSYDIYGPWTTTAGPNAPLARKCDSRNDQGSAEEAIAQWEAAGIPKSQLVLGVPAYGHGFSVDKKDAFEGKNQLALYPKQNATNRFRGSSWDDEESVDSCGNASPPGGTYTYWSLITEAGYLDVYGNTTPGISYRWDNCSRTPALYDPKKEIYINYDDGFSMYEKGRFIVNNGLGGFSSWEAGGDFNNILVNSIRNGLMLP
ncbi:hypothetical protein F66182_5775 [Fusarium sp. NRRL 66182]|nr:hypothetical protein F66182_5775 [Fusarium sp. NRRL 66182]